MWVKTFDYSVIGLHIKSLMVFPVINLWRRVGLMVDVLTEARVAVERSLRMMSFLHSYPNLARIRIRWNELIAVHM